MSDSMRTTGDMSVDKQNLYREETYTDMKIASIKQLIPVKINGQDDKTRKPLYLGQTSVLTPGGILPVNCEIPAKSLEEAIKKFPEAVEQAVNNIIEEAKRYQRDEASRIVVPEAGTPDGLIKLK